MAGSPSELLDAVALIEQRLAAGIRVNVGWQLLGHALLTAGEVLCYGTCLEFSYTQAPARMKSAVMSLMLASISLGNGLTALVNKLIQNPDHTAKLSGAPYYLAFAAFMTVAVVVYVPVAMRFRVKELVSGADDSSPA